MSTVNSWRQPENGHGNVAKDLLFRRSRNTPSLSSSQSGNSLARDLAAARHMPPRQNSFNCNGRSHMLQRSVSMPVPDGASSEFNTSNNNLNNYSKREAGYIEKMLHSYGFIQGSDREVRLFFHFSEYKGDVDTIKIGDQVEFRQSNDRRTGKPIAVSIVKKNAPLIQTPQNQSMAQITNDELLCGEVLIPAKVVMACNGTGDGVTDEVDSLDEQKRKIEGGLGRITYEQKGETFFLSFAVEDVVVGQDLDVGDNVEFYIVADEKYANLRAKRVRRAGTAPLALSSRLPSTSVSSDGAQYLGIVCSMKENYGFIDRADVVKEIFFHYSEFHGDLDELHVGDEVQYGIQIRNSKDVAVGVTLLPAGSVVFEDVHPEKYRGKVEVVNKQTLGSRRQSESQTPVRIVYSSDSGSTSISCGERNSAADFTLFDGDTVEFNLATDRRDQRVRPTNVRLIQEESFKQSQEEREKGFVTTLKEGFGFIRCTDRDARMFFHFKEKLDARGEMELQQEVEFTVIEDPSNANRLIAVRIKTLRPGTIPAIDNCSLEKLTGSVEKEAGIQLNAESDPGIIMYDVNGTKQTLPYSSSAVDGELPRLRDKVEFQIAECVRNGTKTAINVRVCTRASLPRERGHIVTLKDSFGFIEMSDHQHEIFFHFSCVDGSPEDLDLGDEVEFTVSHKSARVCAENIHKISSPGPSSAKSNSFTDEFQVILPGILEGRVLRSVRFNGTEQSDYCGLIQAIDGDSASSGSIDATGPTYPFSITSLVDKRELPQKGDIVKYQVAESSKNKVRRAVNVVPSRRYVHCKITSIKDKTAYVDYEVDNVSLSFELSELHETNSNGNNAAVTPGVSPIALVEGDTVELVIVHSLRGAYSVHNVRKICEKPRPERLVSRLKSVSDETVPRVMTMRQPRGPDGSLGFKGDRPPWTPPPPSPMVCTSAGVTIRAPWSISGPLASSSSFDDPTFGNPSSGSSSATSSPGRGGDKTMEEGKRDKKPLCREDSGAVFY